MLPDEPKAHAPDTPEPELEEFVRGEARRLAAESRMAANPERVAEGWERRFVIEAGRAEHCARLYESLGFEVLTEPVRAEDVAEDCTDCRLLAVLEFRMIYTRRGPSSSFGTPG